MLEEVDIEIEISASCNGPKNELNGTPWASLENLSICRKAKIYQEEALSKRIEQ